MRFATPTRIGKRDMKYMVKLERVLFIRITRPLLDKYRCFQLADDAIFSITPSQIDLAL